MKLTLTYTNSILLKTILLSVIVFFKLTPGNSQNNDYLPIKAAIIENHTTSLKQFSKVARYLSQDHESSYGFNTADGILSEIDLSGKFYYNDLNKIYAAYSYMFYGMSYDRAIYFMSSGNEYSLEELIDTIINPSDYESNELSSLSKNELASIYSIVNFYKVSEMLAITVRFVPLISVCLCQVLRFYL